MFFIFVPRDYIQKPVVNLPHYVTNHDLIVTNMHLNVTDGMIVTLLPAQTALVSK